MNTSYSLISYCRDRIADTLTQYSFEAEYHDTFELIQAQNIELQNRVYGLRHMIFCEEYQYEGDHICDEDGRNSYKECDPYDERSEHFLLRHRVSHELVGTLRVTLPNDEKPSQSFLVQELCDHPLLKMDSKALCLAEISRFAMIPRFRKRASDGRFLSSYHEQELTSNAGLSYRRRIPYPQAALLGAAFEAVMNARILECIWLVEPAHLESLQKIGFSYKVLGPQIDYHGGAQPLIFNIKHTLDSMRDQAPHCWAIISDNGRLQTIANELHRNDWHDSFMEDVPLDGVLGKINDKS